MSVSKQRMVHINSSFGAVDLTQIKELLQKLSDKDRKRVERFLKSRTNYGGNILKTLVGSSSFGKIEFVEKHSMEYLKETQDRIEQISKKIDALQNPIMFDYEEYKRVCELIKSENCHVYERVHIYNKSFSYCTTCNSVASLKSRETVRTDCNSDFCSFGCSRCETTIEKYSCKCSSL